MSVRFFARITILGAMILATAGPRVAHAADMRIGWQTAVVSILLTYADKTGGFEKNGLSVELEPFAAGPSILPALAAGTVDVAFMGESPATVGFINGIPLRIFMVQSLLKTDVRLVANPKSGIKTLADLKGKKIAVTVGSTSQFHLLRALNLAHLTPADVTIVNLPPSGMPPAYFAGQVDAILTWEPATGAVEAAGGVRIATTESLGTAAGLFGVVRTDYLKAHPDRVQKLLSAWNDALKAYQADPKAVIAYDAKRLNKPVDEIVALLKRQTVTFPTFKEQLSGGYMGTEADKAQSQLGVLVHDVAEFLLQTNRIKAVPPNLSDIIDPAPVAAFVAAHQ